jgi:hypothetical protein
VIELSGYVFETLREDEEVAVYRGQKDGDRSAILIIAPLSEHPAVGSVVTDKDFGSGRSSLCPSESFYWI